MRLDQIVAKTLALVQRELIARMRVKIRRAVNIVFFLRNRRFDRHIVNCDMTHIQPRKRIARVEGILPAPESSHAIRVAIDEALKCKETGEEKTILFGLTGTGYFDMVAYEKFHDGKMSDYIPTDEDLAKGFAGIPDIDL